MAILSNFADNLFCLCNLWWLFGCSSIVLHYTLFNLKSPVFSLYTLYCLLPLLYFMNSNSFSFSLPTSGQKYKFRKINKFYVRIWILDNFACLNVFFCKCKFLFQFLKLKIISKFLKMFFGF